MSIISQSGLIGTLSDILEDAGYDGYLNPETDEAVTGDDMETDELASGLGWKILANAVGIGIPRVLIAASEGSPLGIGCLVGFGALSTAYQIEYDDPSLVNGMKRDLEEMGYDVTYIADAFKQYLEDLNGDVTESVLNGRPSETEKSLQMDINDSMLGRASAMNRWLRSGVLTWSYSSGVKNVDKTTLERFNTTISSMFVKAGLCGNNGVNPPISFNQDRYNDIKDANYIQAFAMENKLTHKWFPIIIATEVPVTNVQWTFTTAASTSRWYRGVELHLFNGSDEITPHIVTLSGNNRVYYYGYHGNEVSSTYIEVYPMGTSTVNNFTHKHGTFIFNTSPYEGEGIGDDSAGLNALNYQILSVIANNEKQFGYYRMVTSKKLANVTDNNHTTKVARIGMKTPTDLSNDTGGAIISGDSVRALDDAIQDMIDDPSTTNDIIDVLPESGMGVIDTTDNIPLVPNIPTIPDLLDGIRDVALDKFPDAIIPPIPNLPETDPDPNNTGVDLFSLYKVDTGDLANLGHALWQKSIWDKIVTAAFGNPIDAIISLVAYNIPIQSKPSKVNIRFGNVVLDGGVDVGGEQVQGYPISQYFQEFDLGSIRLNEYFKNFLDYSPYTKVSIYLPYIGICRLNTEDVMNATISVKYRLELLTGNCLAIIHITSNIIDCDMYQFSGTAGVQLPITGSNYTQLVKNAVGAIGAIGGAVISAATGGTATPVAVGVAGGAIGNAAVSSKPEIDRAGSMSGNAGILGNPKPYLIVERPITDIPNNMSRLMGRVSNRYATIGSLTGYNSFDNFDVSTVDCTDEERAEITTLLSAGIFI